jgi:hypothetical protein
LDCRSYLRHSGQPTEVVILRFAQTKIAVGVEQRMFLDDD